MNRYVSSLFAIGLVVVGCKKKEGDKAPAGDEPKGTATATAAKPVASAASSKLPAAFQAWDMAARQAAWQGAWAGDGEALGSKAAWQIDGDKIHFVEGKTDKQLELELQSPCSAALKEKTADGASSSTITAYTLQNGELIAGLGDAGARKGDQAVVCGGGKIFTVDAKGCTAWEENFGKLESKPGECGFRKDAGKDVFFYKANDHESTLLVDGDVIWSEQLKMRHATKHKDLAAARAAQGL